MKLSRLPVGGLSRQLEERPAATTGQDTPPSALGRMGCQSCLTRPPVKQATQDAPPSGLGRKAGPSVGRRVQGWGGRRCSGPRPLPRDNTSRPDTWVATRPLLSGLCWSTGERRDQGLWSPTTTPADPATPLGRAVLEHRREEGGRGTSSMTCA